MKNFRLVIASVLMSATLVCASTMVLAAGQHRVAVVRVAGVEIILQNKCTRDVKYVLKSPGGTTNGVVAKGDKVKVNVAAGTEILVDGEVFMTVADGDAGQTFMVCR